MNLTLQVTEKDYVRAQFLIMRPRPWIKVLGIIYLLVFTLALAIGLYRAIVEYNGLKMILAITIMILFVVWCIWFFFYYLPQWWRKLYHQSKYHPTSECEIDDIAISINNSLGNSKLPWDYFHRWRESKYIFILYPADNLFHIFPKHCFSSEQDVNDFRKLLTEKIGVKK